MKTFFFKCLCIPKSTYLCKYDHYQNIIGIIIHTFLSTGIRNIRIPSDVTIYVHNTTFTKTTLEFSFGTESIYVKRQKPIKIFIYKRESLSVIIPRKRQLIWLWEPSLYRDDNLIIRCIMFAKVCPSPFRIVAPT